MELRVLNFFQAIAREENFTRAAQQLHVTQPTLSRQIANLEQELGVKLFRRSNHNIVLTEDGMILKRRARSFSPLRRKPNGTSCTAANSWRAPLPSTAESFWPPAA